MKEVTKKDKCKRSWTEEENILLKEVYVSNRNREEIKKFFPYRSWVSIRTHAVTLGLLRKGYWDIIKDRDAQILPLLEKMSPPDVAKVLGLKPSHVYMRMYKAGKKPIERVSNNKLCNLLNDTPEAFYWLGFILADGCFSGGKSKIKGKMYNSFSFRLARKDKNSVSLLSKFIGSSINIDVKNDTHNYVGVHCNDIKTLRTLMKKIGLRETQIKTYEPPTKIFNFKGDLLFSLIVGYIDGDGTILKHKQKNGIFARLAVRTHKSWKSIFDKFDLFLYNYFNIERTSNSFPTVLVNYESMPQEKKNRYVVWSINNFRMLKFIKAKAISLGLPVMNRKWNRIKENIVSRRELADIRREEVKHLLKNGLSVKEIIKKTFFTVSIVNGIKNSIILKEDVCH